MTDRLLHLLGNGRIAGRGFRHDSADGMIMMDKDPDDRLRLTIDISKLLGEADEISAIDLLAENIQVDTHSHNGARAELWLADGPHATKPGMVRLRITTIGGERLDQSVRFVARHG